MTPKLQKLLSYFKNHKQLSISVASLFGVILFIGIATTIYFSGKALPNVYLADTSVSGKNAMELTALVNKKIASSKITIKEGKTSINPGLKSLGVSVDVKQTTNNLLNRHRQNLWSRIAFWQSSHVKLDVKVNDQQLAGYINKKLKVTVQPPQNAKIVFSHLSNKFVIKPEKSGSAIDTNQLSKTLASAVANGKSTTLPVSHEKTSAQILASNIKGALGKAQGYVDTSVILTAPGASYQPTVAEKASWVNITPAKTTYKIGLNEAKVKQYVASITGALNVPTKNQDVIKNKDGSPALVVQEGQVGQTVTNQDQVASELVQSLSRKQSYTGKIQTKATPFKTVNMTAEKKWIEVNLSQQSLTAYQESTPVRHFLISSGVPGHETVTGVFHIYIKYASQRMVGGSKASGDYYDLPNVQWVNYFYQDYALHGAYWHHNWGHTMSHGCVNEPNDQAKWVYDWAPIGTTVVVHY